MKVTAAVVNGEKRDFELEEIELDAPKDNEVLIKLVATGVCHTDVAGQDGLTTPMLVVLGHEGTGTCVLIGIGGDIQINVMNDLLAESKKLVGVVEGDSIPQEYIPKLIKYYQDGKFPLDKLIKVYDFQDINQAFANFKAGKVFKPIVKM